MNPDLDTDQKAEIALRRLDKRITDKLASPRTMDKFYQTKLSRAKTIDEKKQIAIERKENQAKRIKESLKTMPVSARDKILMQRMSDEMLLEEIAKISTTPSERNDYTRIPHKGQEQRYLELIAEYERREKQKKEQAK